jgi:serine/threonine-protein kinase
MVAECKVDTHDTTLPSARASQGLPMPLGSVLAGQYRLEELLGAGGMGTVYRACQLSVERQVAVKLISGEHETPEHVERFRREAAALAKLRHPNTVHLLDFGVADAGRPFIVMELLSGTDLEDYLAHHSLTVRDALLITRQIARALSEAHAVGVIHRDLKPSNIYISHVEGGDSFVKVMDFGVAGFCDRAEHSTLTVRGAVVGTAAYMSPEQAQGMEVDARVDVYSLGVILFELLVGRTPFQAPSALSMLVAHINDPPPRLSECKPEYAELTALQSLLDRLLAKAPAERPASAGEVLILVDELIEQLSPGTDSERLTGPKLIAPKRAREGRATWMLAAAALGLLALSAPYSPPSAVASLLPLWAATQAFLSNAHDALSALGTAAGLASEVRIVTVASVPSSATVSLAGAELGVTPYPLQLKRATSLRVEAPGYEPTTLTVEPHGEPNIVVKLSPLPPLRDAE